jgi:O-antigen ligase
MVVIIFITLVAALLFLTVSGGGLFPSTVALVSIIISALACLNQLLQSWQTRLRALPLQGGDPEVDPAPNSPPWRGLGWGHRVLGGTRPEIPLTLLLLLVLLTALPLPPVLDSVAGPLRHEQNQAVITAIQDAAQYGAPALLESQWFSLSRNRAGTLRYFLLLAAAISAGLLTSALPTHWKPRMLVFLVLLGSGVGIAGYLGQWKIPQGDTLWWYIPIPHAPTSPVGCFLNRNHFGGFVAMLCPVALALAVHFLTTRRWLSGFIHLALTTLMAGIVIMSLSRGAMLAMTGGLVFTALFISVRHQLRWGLILLVLLATGGGLLATQHPAVRDRLAGLKQPAQIASVNSRLHEWHESLRVWPHYPVIGAGANALRMVYPQYRQTSVGARLIHAENEYIQLLTELGLIGVALAIAVLVAVSRQMKQGNGTQPGIVVTAVAGALTVTAIHCLIDFPTHLPLYALVLGTLTGLLFAPPPMATIRHRVTALGPALIALMGTVLICLQGTGELKRLDDPFVLYHAKNRELQKALIWAPTSAAWLYLGYSLLKEGNMTHNVPLCRQAEGFITRAALLDPQNYRLWYEVGQIRLSLDDPQRATEAFQRAQALRAWMTPPPIPGGRSP